MYTFELHYSTHNLCLHIASFRDKKFLFDTSNKHYHWCKGYITDHALFSLQVWIITCIYLKEKILRTIKRFNFIAVKIMTRYMYTKCSFQFFCCHARKNKFHVHIYKIQTITRKRWARTDQLYITNHALIYNKRGLW